MRIGFALLLVVAGCGRWGFDERTGTGGDDARRDDTDVDAGGRCADGTCKLVFLTSLTFDGALGGLAGGDADCQQLALAAHLPGTYKAWLSDSSGSPSTRFARATVPYVLVDGTMVASDWTQLVSGTILHAIDRSETGGTPGHDDSNNGCGALPASTTIVWTSTKFDGTDVPVTDCTSWTSNTLNVPSEWGRDDLTTGNWSAFCSSGSCSWHAPLYCFEQ